MKERTPWIVCDANDGGAMKCLRCGDRYALAYPVDVLVACAAMKAYVGRHRGCAADTIPVPEVFVEIVTCAHCGTARQQHNGELRACPMPNCEGGVS